MVALIFGLALSATEVHLSEDDRLSIFAQALHFEASRIKGPVNQFRISTGGSRVTKDGVPFQKLQPLISDFAAPTVDGRLPDEDSIWITADFLDVIDRTHAVVDVFHISNHDDHADGHTLVFAKRRSGWAIEQFDLSPDDRAKLYTSAFVYLLSQKEFGYEKKTSYVAVIDRALDAPTRSFWNIIDPPSSVMPTLWSRGYSLKYASEIPNPKPPGHPPPHTTFSVGDVVVVDPQRALIVLRSEHFNQEPGYNETVGPSNAEWATYLAVKREGKWRMANLRWGWYPDPAE